MQKDREYLNKYLHRRILFIDVSLKFSAFDLELLCIYGIATLLALRQTCRAWKKGVTRKELIEALRSTAF